MKKHISLLAVLALADIASAEPSQVEIQARYEGVDPTYLTGLQDKPTQLFSMPKVIVRLGQEAVIRVVQEHAVAAKPGQSEIRNCGATLYVTPSMSGTNIQIFGKSVLCRPDPSDEKTLGLMPVSFTTRETFLEGIVSPNMEITIKLAKNSDERLVLKFSPQDNEGKPTK